MFWVCVFMNLINSTAQVWELITVIVDPGILVVHNETLNLVSEEFLDKLQLDDLTVVLEQRVFA